MVFTLATQHGVEEEKLLGKTADGLKRMLVEHVAPPAVFFFLSLSLSLSLSLFLVCVCVCVVFVPCAKPSSDNNANAGLSRPPAVVLVGGALCGVHASRQGLGPLHVLDGEETPPLQSSPNTRRTFLRRPRPLSSCCPSGRRRHCNVSAASADARRHRPDAGLC